MTYKLVKLSDVEAMINDEITETEALGWHDSTPLRKLSDSLKSLPTQNEWIPVSERLPEEGKIVYLIFRNYYGLTYGIGAIHGGNFQIDGKNGFQITHWMYPANLPPTTN